MEKARRDLNASDAVFLPASMALEAVSAPVLIGTLHSEIQQPACACVVWTLQIQQTVCLVWTLGYRDSLYRYFGKYM